MKTQKFNDRLKNKINENYDRNVLLFIYGATIAVMGLIAILIATVGIGTEWAFLPASWWVGAMMTWGAGKYKDLRLKQEHKKNDILLNT